MMLFPHRIWDFSTTTSPGFPLPRHEGSGRSQLRRDKLASMFAPTFTDLTPADQPEVQALILAGLEEHWGTLDPTLNRDLDDMLMTYGHGQTILTRANGRVVATGTVVPRDQESAEIVRMSVWQSQRRTGLGRATVEQLCHRAKLMGFAKVQLETSTSWTDVVAFYQRCGFTITHTEVGQFGSDTWFERDL